MSFGNSNTSPVMTALPELNEAEKTYTKGYKQTTESKIKITAIKPEDSLSEKDCFISSPTIIQC